MTTWEKLMLRHALAQTALLYGLLCTEVGGPVEVLSDEVKVLDDDTKQALSDP